MRQFTVYTHMTSPSGALVYRTPEGTVFDATCEALVAAGFRVDEAVAVTVETPERGVVTVRFERPAKALRAKK